MISQTKQKGFTIVELLIVIVIIGILAAISIVAYNGVTQKARDDQRISDARNIVNAAAAYQSENGTWPNASTLKGYSTIKLSGSAADRIGQATGALTAAPVVGDKDTKYWYQVCAGGVRLHYWVEAPTDGSAAGSKSLVTGTCP